jgi:anaerobic magnesium-protoporphyrin IX monomethyl ester cyclase
MSHLLLIRPPVVFSANTYSSPVTLPLASAYLSSALREKGHGVDNIDAFGEALEHIGVAYSPGVRYRGLSHEQILERIAKLRKPDAIAITLMFSQEWPHHEDMINAIGKRFPGVPIIVGGEHATSCAEYILKNCTPVGFAALGEGEETIVAFAEYLDGRRKLEDVDGIWWRNEAGEIVKNKARNRVRTPDQLPWPAWDQFDPEPYFKMGETFGVERGRTMPVVATRGCPYQCTFCSNPLMWTTRYVMRDPVKVVDEIEHYLTKYKADNIDFYDLTAIVKKDWTIAFCNEVKRRGLKFSWQLPSGTRSEALDKETLDAMASSGCMNITYAPESGSEDTLEKIKKKVKLPRLTQSLSEAHQRGMFLKCNLIIGFPHETRWDMMRTVWAAIRFAFIGVDDVLIGLFCPYPGSELYEYLRKKGTIARESRDYFESLMFVVDLSKNSHYCEHVGPLEMSFYRLAGMGCFYFLSYALHPSRILRSIRNYRERKSDSIFELRFFAMLRRKSLERKSRQAEKETAAAR